MKVSDYVVDFLVKKGVTQGFGYPGGSVTNFLDSVNKRAGEITCHVVYHEQAAAFAACGYACVTGEVGLCYATGGPGCTNLLTGIGHAMYDSIPVIAITGNSNTYECKGNMCIRQRGFQENDNVAVMSSLTKYSIYIGESKNIRYELEKAFYIATTGRKGPVHIDLPMDIQREDIDPDALESFLADEGDVIITDVSFEKDLTMLLRHAKRPCLVLGNGIKTSFAKNDALVAVEHLGIPYVTSMIAFDVLGDSIYNNGFVGAYGNRSANFVVAKSDLVIAIGSRLDIRQVGVNRDGFAPNAAILRVDIDDGELSYRVHSDERSVNIDLRKALKIMGSIEITNDYSDWLSVCKYIRSKLAGIDDRFPNIFIKELSSLVRENAVICTDVGQNQVWVAQSFQLKKGQEVFFSGGMGAMGHALPAAIGAYYGGQDRQIICICGDGGMQMNIQELQFISREKLPIKIIVFNNYALGMIRHFQEMYFDNICYQTTACGGYTSPDFVKIAIAYGIEGVSIESAGQVEGCRKMLESSEPCLIEIRIPENTYVVPKLKFGKPNQDQEPLLDRALFDELMKM